MRSSVQDTTCARALQFNGIVLVRAGGKLPGKTALNAACRIPGHESRRIPTPTKSTLTSARSQVASEVRMSETDQMVPETGIEPVRPLFTKRRILSPMCLPISPLGHVSYCGTKMPRHQIMTRHARIFLEARPGVEPG